MIKRCCFFMLLSKQHMRIMTKRVRRTSLGKEGVYYYTHSNEGDVV